MNRLHSVLLACGLIAVAVPASEAAVINLTFQVTATTVGACLANVTNVAFGTVTTPVNSNIDTGTGTLNVNCSAGVPFTINFSLGAGATCAARKMSAGADTLTYNLYTDSTRANVWGDGTASCPGFAGNGSGLQQALTIYGRIPPQTGVAQNSFSDTVQATVNF